MGTDLQVDEVREAILVGCAQAVVNLAQADTPANRQAFMRMLDSAIKHGALSMISQVMKGDS